MNKEKCYTLTHREKAEIIILNNEVCKLAIGDRLKTKQSHPSQCFMKVYTLLKCI